MVNIASLKNIKSIGKIDDIKPVKPVNPSVSSGISLSDDFYTPAYTKSVTKADDTKPSKSKQLDYVDPYGLFPQDPGHFGKFGGGTPLTYKNMANYIFNLFETKKIKTVDDYDNLIKNLMNEKWSQGKGFGSASASHHSAVSTISEAIKNRFPQHLETWQDLSSAKQKKTRETGRKVIRDNAFDRFTVKAENVMNDMTREKEPLSLYESLKKNVGEKDRITVFRNASWKTWTEDGRLQKENPILYDFFKDKMKVPEKPSKKTLAEHGKTDYDYISAFAKKDNPEMFNLFFTRNPETGAYVQKPVIHKIFGKNFLRQMHLMGENLGTTTVANLKNLVSKYEMIPLEFIEKIRRPQYIGTPKMNTEHMLIEVGRSPGEKGLMDLLVDKFDIMGYNWTKNKEGPGGNWNPVSTKEKLSKSDIEKIEEINLKIDGKKKELTDLGLESVFYHPGKKNLVYFGKTDENLVQLRKEYLAGNRKEGGLVRPHMSLGGDMAQFTEMESVVPDLNPAEAGMEDYTQLAFSAISKFKNPFKKVDPPPIMSDASSGLKIISKAPPVGTQGHPSSKWTIFDNDGLARQSFSTKKEANEWMENKKRSVNYPKDDYEDLINWRIEKNVPGESKTSIFHLKSDLEIANSPLDKMNAQQWNGYLLKNGVSPTEMHEFGLGNLLKNIGGFDEGTKKWKNNAPITKAELISQYKNNKPVISYKIQQMEPFEKGWKDFQNFLTGQRSGGSGYLGDMPAGAREFEEMRRLRNKPQDIIGDRLRTTTMNFARELSERTGKDIKGAWLELEPQITSNINKIIKEAYGIENVVENGFGNVKVPFYTQNLVNRFRRLKSGEGFYMGKIGVGHEGAQFLSGGTGYIEIPFTYNPNPKGMRANEPKFTFGEGHFTNPEGNNPVFWLRASERVDERGNRVFLIEEIQPDMHQKPKQKPDTFKYSQRHDTPGFIDQTYSLAQVKKLKDDLVKVSDQIDKIIGHTDPSAITVMERLKVKREALRNQIREMEDLISEAAGKSDEVFPEGPWKKSENQAKIAIKTLINLATQEGFDSVAMISAKAKNHAVGASADIAKGNRGFYDNIAVSGMKNVAKNLDLEFSSTNIKDGNGNTWAKIPIINLKKEPVKASVDMYKSEGGFIYRPSFVDVVPVL